MEILPYCFCCCMRGISDSFRTCFLPNSRNTKECRKDERNKQNKRLKKQELLQNRRKQEKLQNQRRNLDVLMGQKCDKNGMKMLKFDHHRIGKTDQEKYITSDSDGRQEADKKLNRKRMQGSYKVENYGYNGHDGVENQVGTQGHIKANHNGDLIRHANHARYFPHEHEMSKLDTKNLSKLRNDGSQTHMEHKIEQTTIHTVITKQENKLISHANLLNNKHIGNKNVLANCSEQNKSLTNNKGIHAKAANAHDKLPNNKQVENKNGFTIPSEQKKGLIPFGGNQDRGPSERHKGIIPLGGNQDRGANHLRSILQRGNVKSKEEVARKVGVDKQKKHCQGKGDIKNNSQSKSQKNIKAIQKLKK